MNGAETKRMAKTDDDFDIGALAARLWARRWWIAAITGVSVLTFGVVAFLTPPAYRAATISVAASPDESGLSSNLGGLAAIAGIDIRSKGNVEETLAVLRSREFSEAFIERHDLMPGLFPSRWDRTAKRWKGPANDRPTLAEGYNRFNRKIRFAAQDQKTDLITVAIVWSDPVKAAELANDLTSQLNSEMRSRAIKQTNAAVQFLQKELENTAALDTRGAISRLMETQINQRMYANVTEEFALRVVGRALPPDPKDKIRPKKAMMLTIGALVGVFLGSMGVLLTDSLRRSRHAHP